MSDLKTVSWKTSWDQERKRNSCFSFKILYKCFSFLLLRKLKIIKTLKGRKITKSSTLLILKRWIGTVMNWSPTLQMEVSLIFSRLHSAFLIICFPTGNGNGISGSKSSMLLGVWRRNISVASSHHHINQIPGIQM